MEQKCIPSADNDSTGCHLNIQSTKATTANNTPEKALSSPLRSLQMSSKEQELQLQTHNNNVSDKRIYEIYESSIQNSLGKHEDEDEGRGSSISTMSTPAADNIALFKDDDSRSGSSDDIATPIVELHHLQCHRHKQQNGNEDETTSTSTRTIEAIQGDHRCQSESQNNGGVGVGIYLETPVIDEQIVGLNSHDYENAKPKRLSDEFLLSALDECCDDERNSSGSRASLTYSRGTNTFSDNSLSKRKRSGLVNDCGMVDDVWRSVLGSDKDIDADDTDVRNYSESRYENGDKKNGVPRTAESASMAFRFKNISIDYRQYDKVDDGLTDAGASAIDVADNDVQSMDAIERRDFEHEQRLTGGIILKSSSFAKNDRLKLELVQPNMQNANNQQRAVSSDSKCTYKDHSTTPTSSRNCSSRLTKSTAKINLTTSLGRHPEIITNGDDQVHAEESQNHQDDILENISRSPNHHKVQEQQEPSSSKSLPESASSSSSAAAAAATAAVESSSSKGGSKKPLSRSAIVENAARSIFELFLNSNSNDSLTSEHSYSTSSSHSLSNLTKPIQPECSGISSSASSQNPGEEVLKKAAEQAESIQVLQQQQNQDGVNEDDVATTSSSARCQYSALKYIRNTQRKDSVSALDAEDSVTLSASAEERVVPPPTSGVSSMFAMNNNSHSNFELDHLQLNQDATSVHHNGADLSHPEKENDYDEETWADCEEGPDAEICTCYKDIYLNQSKCDMSDLLSEDAHSKDVELSSYIQMVSISEDTLAHEQNMSPEFSGLQRKRKFTETRLVDADTFLGDTVSGRKRIAYDYASTPRSSQSLLLIASPSTPLGRRTPRSLIPTRDNPPPELQDWLLQFQRWSHAERLLAVDRLIEHCEPTQVRHMMKVIEPQFQRDFISLLPRELALQVLAYLHPKDLLRAAQTCRSWKFLCDDNLLWKEKCRKAQILTEPKTDRPKRGRAGNMPPIASPWKAAYMRQHIIEMNWRSRPIREPKVLKGHDDHVITCLQFSGNRIVSGSDDNTLKVWSAVTGRCLRTLVGHTGGVWSSQMSGNIIISGSTDRTLKVWDMETGQCVHTLLGHTSTVRCMHLHGKKVVSGSRDATLRVWDIDRGSCLHVLVGHLAAVRCVQYDGKLIVSGAYDYMVKIWHPERQECLHTLQGHTNRVYSLQFDGIHVVSGSLDTSIRVWDVETGNCKHTLMGHQSLTSGMELRQNILVSGNADSTVKVWDITSGQCLQTLSGPNKHQSAVTCLQFNSRFVITSSDDGTVKLWDVKTGEFIRNLVALDSGGSGGVVWRIRANDTKLICAVGSRNGTEETKLMVLDFDVEGACVKCS